jgi:hypothetical protein
MCFRKSIDWTPPLETSRCKGYTNNFLDCKSLQHVQSQGDTKIEISLLECMALL